MSGRRRVMSLPRDKDTIRSTTMADASIMVMKIATIIKDNESNRRKPTQLKHMEIMIKLGEVIIPQIKHIKTNILGYNGKQAKNQMCL